MFWTAAGRKEIACVPTRVRAVVLGRERGNGKTNFRGRSNKVCVWGGGKKRYQRLGTRATRRAGRRQGPHLDTATRLLNTTR